MLYGLYLSAAGVMTNSYRQDVIANNLANAETTGFKKDIALFKERLTAAQENVAGAKFTNPLQEKIGGGTFAMPTSVDVRQGDLETTGNNLDVAIEGEGYFNVQDRAGPRLTRDGQFMLNRDGSLVLANGTGQKVLDADGKPIQLDPALRQLTTINKDGTISQDGRPVARLGLVDVADRSKLSKQGGNLLAYDNAGPLRPSDSQLHSETVERANVDPAIELTDLMETQRQLEANANMIRYQDQTLGRAVNDVGKIS